MTIAFLLAILAGFAGVMTQWIRAENLAENESLARQAAEKAEDQTRRYLYVARMNLAQQASETNQTRRLLELLSPYQPGTKQDHLRGFEWYYWWRTCHLYQKSLEREWRIRQRPGVSPDPRDIGLRSRGRQGETLGRSDRAARVHPRGERDRSPRSRLLSRWQGVGDRQPVRPPSRSGICRLGRPDRPSIRKEADVSSLAFSPGGSVLAVAFVGRHDRALGCQHGSTQEPAQGTHGDGLLRGLLSGWPDPGLG